MKRVFDMTLASISIVILLLPMIIVIVLVRLSSPGPILYWSQRIGRNNVQFRMPKFRTMLTEAPVVASHLLVQPSAYLTPVGRILRKTSLDEVPQLWCILRGDMSFVGPRPALFNQYDLISLRESCGIHTVRPGLTGLAQIRGRDDLTIDQKVAYDEAYVKRQSMWLDLSIIAQTMRHVILRSGISH